MVSGLRLLLCTKQYEFTYLFIPSFSDSGAVEAAPRDDGAKSATRWAAEEQQDGGGFLTRDHDDEPGEHRANHAGPELRVSKQGRHSDAIHNRSNIRNDHELLQHSARNHR